MRLSLECSYARLIGVLLITWAAAVTTAQTTNRQTKAENQALELSILANQTFKEFTDGPNAVIPQDILNQAYAVAVFPDVSKISLFLIGRNKGNGLISRRITSGWSAPAYYRLDALKLGPQYGVSRTDLVLLFMSRDSVEGLLKGKFKIGDKGKRIVIDEINKIQNPVSPRWALMVNASFKSERDPSVTEAIPSLTTMNVIAYSRRKGYFGAHFSPRGVVLKPKDDLNRLVVEGLTAKQILAFDPKLGLEKSNPKHILLTQSLLQTTPNNSNTVRPPVYAKVTRDPKGTSFHVEYCETCRVEKNNDNEVTKTTGQFDPVPKYDPDYFEIKPNFHWFKWSDRNGKSRAVYRVCNDGCEVICIY